MLANLSDRYSGTRLFTVLNIKDFSCLARLSARLSHLRAWIIGAELASQLDPVIMRAALFWSFSSFWLRPRDNPGAILELLAHTTGSFLSECNYTEDITEKKKGRLAHLSRTGDCKGKYACISSLLIKPEIHGETRELSTWIIVFQLVNQISVDIIWRTSFHIYNLFMTYNFTALY